MINYINKKREIQALVDNGRMIIELQQDNLVTFFDVQSFDPSVASSTSSIDFNSFKRGVDINEFLNNSTIANSPVQFLSLFNQFIEREPKINMKFSNKYGWRQYYK